MRDPCLDDREWMNFMQQWNHPALRLVIAESIPSIVAIIWKSDFLNLSISHSSSTHPISAADNEAIHATRKLLQAILMRTKISTAAMLLALFFIHRYRSIPQSELGMPGSQYRMFLMGMLLAHKYTEDHPFTNLVWSQLSSLPIQHINVMERDFLIRVDHRLLVCPQEYRKWVVGLDRRFGWTVASLRRLNQATRQQRNHLTMTPSPPRIRSAPQQTARLIHRKSDSDEEFQNRHYRGGVLDDPGSLYNHIFNS